MRNDCQGDEFSGSGVKLKADEDDQVSGREIKLLFK